jgi:hypothetical protein
LQGSTPDHHTIFTVRPFREGLADIHRTLRGLIVRPFGLMGVGSTMGATVAEAETTFEEVG